MSFTSDDLGGVNDRVTLELDGEQVSIAEAYNFSFDITEGPAKFWLRLGWGTVIRDLIAHCQPRTQCSLKIRDVLIFTGELDGFEASGETGATTLTVRGEDDLAPLHRAHVKEDTLFTDATYVDLVTRALKESGIVGYSLVISNEANRKAVSGAGGSLKQKKPPLSAIVAAQVAGATTTLGSTASLTGFIALTAADEVFGESNVKTSATAGPSRKCQAKVGQTWGAFITAELARAGLFLWAGPEKVFILSAPNGAQNPLYRIVRRRGQKRNEVNVISAKWTVNTQHRYTEAICFCRGGGKGNGRPTARAAKQDAEMISYGYDRSYTLKDHKATTPAQVKFLAAKCIAESRRAGWQLAYSVSGHTTPIIGSESKRAVWSADTVVHVQDDEFGIDEDLYIIGVEHHRGPETTTDLTLCRPADLVYGDEDAK